MKRASIIFVILAFTCTMSSSFLSAQDSDESVDAIKDAITKGSAKELAVHFNTAIELSVPGEEGTYSKIQAELIIKDFFEKNKPESFKINHKGSSNEGSQYAICTLTTVKASFRLYFLIKNNTGKSLIHQMQIEEE